MQKTKELNIGGKRVTVKELLVRDIYELIQKQGGEENNEDTVNLKDQVEVILGKCTGLTLDELLDYYPGEMVELWDAVMEVNKAFFDLPRKMGLGKTMEALKIALETNFCTRFLGSLAVGTDQ